MTSPIYLDHAATTPLCAEAFGAMEPFFTHNYANASSIYRLAQAARSAIDEARDAVADRLGARPSEIIFTSGGTESDNAAVKGVAFARQGDGRHLITCSIEHHAVLHPLQELQQRFGFEVTVVPVGHDGIVDVTDVEQAIRPDTTLVSVMWANNEIGTVQPIEALSEITHSRGITLHVDGVQAAGVLPIDLGRVRIDALSISAHKFYGPKGAGALFLRQGTPWWPFITGGGQERNRRAGTDNVAGIVGTAAALARAYDDAERENCRVRDLRELFFSRIPERLQGVSINGDRDRRLPNNVNFSFESAHGESLLVGLDLAGIMASSGSACTSGSTEPSHVLRALAVSEERASSSLRLTLGRDNTMQEVEHVIEVLVGLVNRLREVS